LTAVAWAISPMFMASVGRRIGSQPTNLLRAVLATAALVVVVLPLYVLVVWLVYGKVGIAVPRFNQCAWLMISGTVGMVIGDAVLLRSARTAGPRRAVKVNTLAPVVGLLAGGGDRAKAEQRRDVGGGAGHRRGHVRDVRQHRRG